MWQIVRLFELLMLLRQCHEVVTRRLKIAQKAPQNKFCYYKSITLLWANGCLEYRLERGAGERKKAVGKNAEYENAKQMLLSFDLINNSFLLSHIYEIKNVFLGRD